MNAKTTQTKEAVGGAGPLCRMRMLLTFSQDSLKASLRLIAYFGGGGCVQVALRCTKLSTLEICGDNGLVTTPAVHRGRFKTALGLFKPHTQRVQFVS